MNDFTHAELILIYEALGTKWADVRYSEHKTYADTLDRLMGKTRNARDVALTKPDCDHYDTRLPDDPRPFYEFDDFYFCPKCGEKL